jgi:L-2-hydroxyglutarate oxidase LhgO
LSGGEVLADGTTELRFTQDGETVRIIAEQVINSAGLGAQGVAHSIVGFPPEHIPKLFMSKGQYFAMTGKSPFTTLIYPTPHAAALGIHLTLDLAGQARFGPDHQWVEEENYDVNPDDAAQIYDVVRRYYPGLRDGSLHPDYAGIRCKTQGPGEPPQDWKIFGPATHGIANHVHLFGMESPALTSCLAIADYVTGLLD